MSVVGTCAGVVDTLVYYSPFLLSSPLPFHPILLFLFKSRLEKEEEETYGGGCLPPKETVCELQSR